MASIQSDLSGTSDIEIDGLRPAATLTPQAPEEVAELLATADRTGQAIAPTGGGTKLALGNAPRSLDAALSIKALDRVLHYEPTDLTLSVQAGIRFAEVQSILAERGQCLPIEVPDADRATIGGLIATAITGPRRFGSGTLRDLLIGIAVAYPSGIVGKAGGLVVKNVTGFDLMRLHLGALGTLGVVVSANFKVLPAARHEATLVSLEGSFGEALAAASSAKRERLRPIAVEMFNAGGGWATAVRLEGRLETVGIGLQALSDQGSWAHVLSGGESRAWWRDYLSGQSLAGATDRVALRCGFPAKATAEKVPALMAALAAHDISHEIWNVSPGLGSALVRFSAPAAPGSLAPLQSRLLELADSVVILTAPPALKKDLDVWGRSPATIDVMRALKAEFDPNHVLNPGRFIGRL